jgi:hydrogenase nickel incorporation protein HypA/HybF
MHEYALVQNIIKEILTNLKGRGITLPGKVKEIYLKVGALEMHSTDAFKQAFEILSKETALEGAAMQLTVLPITLDCASCGFKGPYAAGELDVHNPPPVVECPQCGQATPAAGGRGVQDLEMVLEED